MSFILDALRRSEIERQQEAAPRVVHLPLAVARPALPVWALGVMAALTLCVLALAGAWWHGARAPGPGGGTPSATAGDASAPGRPVADTAPGGNGSAPAPTGSPAPPTQPAPIAETEADIAADIVASLDLESTARGRAGGPFAGEAAAGEAAAGERPSGATVAASAGSAAPRTEADLPTRGELVAEGVAVPALRIDLHAFGENVDQRFLFLNGTRYAEGDRLDQGTRVVTITRHGAILSHDGREFRLSPE